MTEEYAGPRKPCDVVHGGDECAAVDEGYWGDDEEEIASSSAGIATRRRWGLTAKISPANC